MNTAHFEFWPHGLAKTLEIPDTTLYDNLVISTKKYPNKIALSYYGAEYTYSHLLAEVEALAGYLEKELGISKGDKILLFMQNAPQFIISYYAILRVRAVVVPINPMSTSDDLAYFIKDGSIRHGIIGQELYGKIENIGNDTSLEKVITAAYSDYAGDEVELPPVVLEKTLEFDGVPTWKQAIGSNLQPSVYIGDSEDVAVLPYTSGTTGLPKGCIHPHRTIQANTVGAYHWGNVTSSAVVLMTLPLFHVTGMVHSMHLPIYAGGTIVMMTRWDRDVAARLIEKNKCTGWTNISTMLIDFLSNPKLAEYDISSLQNIGGGGAALPAAIGDKLNELTGLKYVEGYGLTETISSTNSNPRQRPKLQCLGIPLFDTDIRIIEPTSGVVLGVGEEGELVVNGPQVMNGYYNRDEENRISFIEIEGKLFFRTGDIVKVDDEGYFFMVDRVKRMINASGFKVWPTEVESLLYKHPAIQQACVIGVPDPRRGETVKAFVILNEGYEGKISGEEIIEWSKEQMAAYKYPRFIEFRDAFPMTSSGKILWRQFQDEEREKSLGV